MADVEGMAGRLREELKARSMDLRTFAEGVREASEGAMGSSYGSVWSYVKGKVSEESLRPNIVESMARVLGVRPEWLLDGEGARTRQEEMLRQERGKADPETERHLTAWRAFRRVRKRTPTGELNVPLEEAFLRLALDLLNAERPIEEWTEDEMEGVLEPLAWLWHLPATALRGRGYQKRVETREFEAYFMAMYQALAAIVPGPGTRDLVETKETLWKVRNALRGFRLTLPPSATKRDGVWWYGPFCPNETHKGPERPAMEYKDGVYTCPVCGERYEERE
jgi:transcriptional regulator with XRE-family HTH domain